MTPFKGVESLRHVIYVVEHNKDMSYINSNCMKCHIFDKFINDIAYKFLSRVKIV